jgi:hypothetical protein
MTKIACQTAHILHDGLNSSQKTRQPHLPA